VAVLVKLVPEIPVDELTVLRYAVQWAIAAVFLAAASWRARKREEPAPWNGVTWLVISFMCVRSAGYFCMIYLMWSALRLLPVGDATILVYTSPLWTMLLSRMFLKQPLPLTFALYAAMGVAGAVLVVQPGFLFGNNEARLDPFGVSLALGAAFSAATMQVITYRVKAVHWVVLDHTTTLLCWAVFSPLVLIVQMCRRSQPLAVFDAWLFTPHAAGIVVSMAFMGFFGLCLNTIGYKIESPARGALIAYIEIPISYGLQVAVWHDHPDELAWLGVSLVLLCTLFNTLEKFWHTRRQQKEAGYLTTLQTPITSADHATEAYHAGQPSDAEGDSDFADRGEKTPQEEKDDDELCAYSEGWMSHSENLMSHSASEPHHRRLLGP